MKILRGWIGEKKTAFTMWLYLNADIYRKFHDVIIPTDNGTTQIDHVLVSPYGIFIVETKNMKGWIFGSERQPKWTQTLYRKKYSFQNPLRQTFRQKKILAEYLEIDESSIHTVIYFIGNCKFKTELPENVIRSGLGQYIKTFRDEILEPEDVDWIVEKLERHVSESMLTTYDHVKSLRKRHNSTTTCPKCGSDLIERTARKGPKAGSKFLGCENFPKCRFTKNP